MRASALSAGGISLGLVLLIFSLSAPAAPDVPVPEKAGKLRIIDLEGTPYQMGLTHGRTLKAEIGELLKRWKADLEKTHRVPADVFIGQFLKQTDFRPAVDRWTPGLIDEVRGIAEGAGVDFETMFAYQLLDESWVMESEVRLDKCTSIAAGKRRGQPAYVAQTMDVPLLYHGFPIILRFRDKWNDLETLVYTIPGLVAVNGMNSRSVAVCVNAVTPLAHSSNGLPVAFVIRGILRQETYAQAVKFLAEIPPAAPQNYMIGGPDEAASFERSVRRMSRYLPFDGAEFTYHTNHPLINDDFKPGFLESLKSSGMTLEQYRAMCPRFDFLSRIFPDNSAVIDLDGLKTVFRNRASGINNEETYGCTIMVLGDTPELLISPGRPDEEPFQVLTFSRPIR